MKTSKHAKGGKRNRKTMKRRGGKKRHGGDPDQVINQVAPPQTKSLWQKFTGMFSSSSQPAVSTQPQPVPTTDAVK